MKQSLGWLICLLLLVSAAEAAPAKVRTPSPGDKCPVCGMFVAKYPDFSCQIVFKDGSSVFFDGAKDLFKYYLNLRTYAPKRKPGDIVSVLVTGYYSLTPIDGRTAWYVLGSDVYGPMGRELIPFAAEAEAKEFMADHKGKKILRFHEIALPLLRGLDG